MMVFQSITKRIGLFFALALAGATMSCAVATTAPPASDDKTAAAVQSGDGKEVAPVPGQDLQNMGQCPDPDAAPTASDETKKGKKKAARQREGRKDCYSLNSGKKSKRCEPQSLPYARCRSGIKSCQGNYDNGPLSWFACEKKEKHTSDLPQAGSILIVGSEKSHKMPTGHVVYVENATHAGGSTYRLVLSHTNYDRKCALETDIVANYDRATMTVDFLNGAWNGWGRNLKVAGFILPD